MRKEFHFSFAGRPSKLIIQEELPSLESMPHDTGRDFAAFLAVCDEHTLPLAEEITRGRAPVCVLPSGEEAKTWNSVQCILAAARESGIGRDGLIAGIGGGVVTDLAGFAASVYMRGTGLCFVSTTLLGMVDAAIGGKTGFDLFGVKNLIGTFYPASLVYLPARSLRTLPPAEWKSGMAELIKTAVIGDAELFQILNSGKLDRDGGETLAGCIARAAAVKGRIVEADPEERGSDRVLLNLGHTFGHALESSAGLGKLSHGEAVAWGMARACDLGIRMGLTPGSRALEITGLLEKYDFELKAPHPLIADTGRFIAVLGEDKKKRAGMPSFVVPGTEGARIVPAAEIKGGWKHMIENITNGASS